MAGPLVAFTPKKVGRSVKAGRSCATVESGKWVGPAKSAAGGEVIDRLMGTAISRDQLKTQSRVEFIRTLGLRPDDPRLIENRRGEEVSALARGRAAREIAAQPTFQRLPEIGAEPVVPADEGCVLAIVAGRDGRATDIHQVDVRHTQRQRRQPKLLVHEGQKALVAGVLQKLGENRSLRDQFRKRLEPLKRN